MYHELPLYFPFPSQNIIRKYLAKGFEKYPTTWITIDGTDIFIERATWVKTQTQPSCIYKHHNTWKALVGISANGTVIFVSSVLIFQVSDWELTKCSN